MKTAMWISVIGILLVPNAYAQLKTTVELKAECELVDSMASNPKLSDVDFAKGASCLAYIRGYLDAAMFMQSVRDAKPIYCVNDRKMTIREFAATILEYVAAHPDQTNIPAANTVAMVVAETYPCKR